MELGLGETLRFESFHVVSNLTQQIGGNQYYMGRFEEARASLEEALALARHHRDADTACWSQSFLAACCAAMGDLESALRHAREAVEGAERYTSRHSAIWAYWGLGRVLIAHDRLKEACATLEPALATMRERRIHVSFEAELLQLIAEAHLGLGQQERARAECSEAIAAARLQPSPNRAARFTAAVERPPITRGTGGSGAGRMRASSNS